MYNDFDSIGVKISSYIKKYKWIIALVLLCIIILLIILLWPPNKEKENSNMEKELNNIISEYLDDNDPFEDTNASSVYVSFDELGYTPDKEYDCNDEGGIIVYDSLDYDYIYDCKEDSNYLINLKKNNQKVKDYISLKGKDIIYLDYSDKYIEPGYKSSYEVVIDNPIYNEKGVYLLSYMVDNDDGYYSATRTVIVLNQNKENEEPEITYVEPSLIITNPIMTIGIGEAYVDPGYEAIDDIDGNITGNVNIKGEVNTNKVGTYTITYSVTNKGNLTTVKTRTVSVIKKEKSKIELIGNETIYLDKNQKFVEPGYQATDGNGNDISNNVIIFSNLNTTVAGNYYVEYIIEDEYEDVTAKRLVNVKESTEETNNLNISMTLSTNEYTSSSIILYVRITGDDYNYTLLPNSKTNNTKSFNYIISKNGEYKFTIYNKNGSSTVKTITINNIVNSKPSGTCTYKIVNKTFVITVTSTGSLPIVGYNYNNGRKTSGFVTTSTYSMNIPEADNVSVTIKDKASNTTTIKCTGSTIAYDPIEPTQDDLTNGKIVKQEIKDTIKFWIVKKKSVYLTRVWVKDPFTQITQFYAVDMNKKYTTIPNLMNALEKQVKNKVALAVNDGNSGNKHPGIIIRRGEFISVSEHVHPYRDTSSAINKQGYLQIFGDNLINKKQYGIEYVMKEREKMVALKPNIVIPGVKHVTQNWQARSYGGVSANRASRKTGLCQIDRNNWVIISTSSSVYNENTLGVYFEKLGCLTGVNLDGGSSTAYYAKKSTESTFTKYVTNSGIRNIFTDILYFTE